MRVEIKTPYLLFLGDEPDITHAKTAVGVSHWRPDACIGQYRLSGSGVDLGFPDITPAEAASNGFPSSRFLRFFAGKEHRFSFS